MKWIGCALILFACAAMCVRTLQTFAEKKKECRRLSALLSLISQEISQYETPLPQILQKATETVDFAADFWQDTAQNGLAGAYLQRAEENDAARAMLFCVQDFFAVLGKSAKGLQLSACESARAKLAEMQTKLDEETPKKIRLCITTSLCVGASLVILLL